MIAPVSSIPSIPLPSAPATSGSSGDFNSVLQGTISTIEGLQNDADGAVKDFLTGKNEELHTTVLATQRAEMAFELGLQVRNKAISAYQEIMKMQL